MNAYGIHPVADVRNILIRCGQPHDVWKLTGDAIATCTICRKYSRAGRHPQYKTHLASNFNELVQCDVFQFQDNLFILVIDEATRYKVATSCNGRYLVDILSALMRGWIRYFGPMRILVTDQESSLMTVEAGEEFQRLGIERRPAGTTTRKQGQQHTTTGLVERHIDLVKIGMLKIQAESNRYGIELQPEDLAAEAAMAQNLTLSVGGYTPATMLFGVLPRGFLDPEGDQPVADPNESSFEKSLRLRQIALQSAQAAILESRIARAPPWHHQGRDLQRRWIWSRMAWTSYCLADQRRSWQCNHRVQRQALPDGTSTHQTSTRLLPDLPEPEQHLDFNRCGEGQSHE